MVSPFPAIHQISEADDEPCRIEEMPMSKASEAVQGVKNNKAKYRYVLTQDLV